MNPGPVTDLAVCTIIVALSDPVQTLTVLCGNKCGVYQHRFKAERFFNVSGGIFVDKECDPSIKASAQGLFMLMTNGLGATIGTLSAGAVVNHFCTWQQVGDTSYLMGNWPACWFIFAGFALCVFVAFALVFNNSVSFCVNCIYYHPESIIALCGRIIPYI